MSDSTPPSLSAQNLWKDVIVKMKDYIAKKQEVGGDVKTYIPPFNSLTFGVGNDADTASTNYAVYQAGDSLLSSNSPLFIPGDESYSKRLQGYLIRVKLRSQAPGGVLQALGDSERNAGNAANDYYSKTLPKAHSYYKQVTGKTATNKELENWAAINYPPLTAIKSFMEATEAAYESLLQAVEGPEAVQLRRQRRQLGFAMDTRNSNEYNMTCSRSGEPIYLPAYNIDQTYQNSVRSWIGNSADVPNSGLTLNFDCNDQASQSWSSLGYGDIKFGKSSIWHFSSARYQIDGQEKTENIDPPDNSDIKYCTLAARRCGVFRINPGSQWDVSGFQKAYPELVKDSPEEFKSPMYLASSVLVGYQVTLKISMSSNFYGSIKASFDKASQSNGSISIMGTLISASQGSLTGTSFSSVKLQDESHSLEIPVTNNSAPVVLGIIGRRVGQ